MPPIILKNYEWSETCTNIDLVVSIPGIAPGKSCDIVLTDKYIKIRYAHYLWELFLKYCISRESSTFAIGMGTIRFNLLKVDATPWLEVVESMPEDKKYVIKRREEEINKLHQFHAHLQQETDRRRQELNRIAIREQIKLEEREKERIKAEISKEVHDTLIAESLPSPPLVKGEGSVMSLPPIRSCGTISVTFSASQNSAPSRESTASTQEE